MAAIDFKKLSVLVVEDESFTRRTIRTLLVQVGVRTILEASNGRDGLLEVIDKHPDVVFCDVHMKPVSGLEMVQKIRTAESREIAATPVVMLTTDASKGSVIFAKSYAVEGYLVKPVALIQIRSRLEAIVWARPELLERVRAN